MTLPTFEVSPLLERLFESSWQAAVLVLLVLAVQRAFGRRLTPAWRHALWWIVLGRLLLPVTPTSAWSLFNLLPAGEVEPRSLGTISPVGSVRALPSMEPMSPMVPPSSFDPDPTPANGTSSIPFLLAVVWSLGAAGMFLRLTIQNARFSRKVRQGMRPASVALNTLLNECRAHMKVRRPIPLLQGDAVASPALYGVFRTRLLLPSKVAHGCTPSQLRHVFLHELAHVRRHDLFVNGLSRILHALHWFNPVLAWAFRRIRADRELATDALALRVTGERESRACGLTIVNMLEGWTTKDPQPGTVGILEDSTSLEHRIRAIAMFRRPSRWAPATALLLALLAAISWTNAQPPLVPLGSALPSAPLASSEATPTPASPTGKGRQLIQSRLESIRLPEVKYEHLPLGELVRILKEETKARSLGVNFFMNPILDDPAAGAAVSVNPNTGAATVIPPPEQVPLSDVIIHIDPPLHDIRMIDLLDVITQSASVPIAYTIEDYAVVFMYKAAYRPKLLTRTYRGGNGVKSRHATN